MEKLYEFLKLVRNRQKMPQRCKEALPVPIFKKADKTLRENYRRIALLDRT